MNCMIRVTTWRDVVPVPALSYFLNLASNDVLLAQIFSSRQRNAEVSTTPMLQQKFASFLHYARWHDNTCAVQGCQRGQYWPRPNLWHLVTNNAKNNKKLSYCRDNAPRPPWTRLPGLHLCRWQCAWVYRASVKLTYLIHRKAAVLCEITRNDGHWTVQFKVTQGHRFGINRKPVCDTALAYLTLFPSYYSLSRCLF